jgi:hypothetical protein
MLQHFKGHFSVLSSVEEVGFEPTQPEGNSFTDCPSSPTLAYFRIWLSWWLLVSRPDLSPLRHHLGFTLDRHSLCNNQIQSKPKEQSLIQYTKKTDNTKIFFYFFVREAGFEPARLHKFRQLTTYVRRVSVYHSATLRTKFNQNPKNNH